MTRSTRTRKIDQIIRALLEHGTIRKAATALGMSEVTVWRWMQKPGFQAAYSSARRDVMSRLGGRLLHGSSAAVSTISKVMVDPNAPAAVRVRAADCILEHAAKIFELFEFEDVAERLKRLEEAAAKP
jgi:DNA-binding MurR/RpiR family transcriptional regulator